MFDSNDFVKVIKKIAVDAINASKPTDVVFGKVISETPLKIKVDQKLILTERQLVLARDLTDYEIEMEMEPYEGRKKFRVYNALKNDEKVIMIQVSGGQKYIVIDRIGKG